MADAERNSRAQYMRPAQLVMVGIVATIVMAGALRAAIAELPTPPLSGTPNAPVVLARKVQPARVLELPVRRGDTLSGLFAAHGLATDDLAHILSMGGATRRFREIVPGDVIVVRADPSGRVLGLSTDLDESQRLEVERVVDGFAVRTIERPIERRRVVAHGEIQSSLFASAAQAGLSGALTMALAGVFGYDIDFLQDLRKGDGFTVIYEELWRDGAKLRDGAILAAEFDNDGRRLQAIRFESADGRFEYYSPDGASMRKALTRNPVDFTRISSGFSSARFHPILHRIRAHEGVDYVAPRGTPVRAAGDGKIVFRGVRGGYGNAIVIQHGATYSTLYGHLSRFARGLSVGSRVVQDQVIGFVGATGLATAPHLHYEILVNGVHRNPRTVKLPDSAAVPEARRAEFRATADPLLQELDRERQSASARLTTS